MGEGMTKSGWWLWRSREKNARKMTGKQINRGCRDRCELLGSCGLPRCCVSVGTRFPEL